LLEIIKRKRERESFIRDQLIVIAPLKWIYEYQNRIWYQNRKLR